MSKSKPVSFVIATALVVLGGTPAFAQLQLLEYAAVQEQNGLPVDKPQVKLAGSLLEPKTIFVTSMTYDGDLGGLEGADQKCQARANASGSIVPPGQYVALLSTSSLNASARLTPSIGPVIRPDGTLVAGNFAELFRTIHAASVGNLLAPPNIDELGNSVTTDFVWTGSSPSGLRRPDTCNDWNSDNISDKGKSGIPNTPDASWIAREAAPDTCNKALRLYCVLR